MTRSYEDIINLPRHVSKTRPPMSIINRAAQFAPFAALTGHDAAVKETARLTDKRVELDECEKERLNDKLQLVAECLEDYPEISITYFQPDSKKAGGSYVTTTGQVKKIDAYRRVIVMSGGITIPIEEILDIDGSLFSQAED
ncbi:MAG: YolD-like family protein [Firmicutes bacterium]|nr:YolD-like family protein [Bacillota bacterium]